MTTNNTTDFESSSSAFPYSEFNGKAPSGDSSASGRIATPAKVALASSSITAAQSPVPPNSTNQTSVLRPSPKQSSPLKGVNPSNPYSNSSVVSSHIFEGKDGELYEISITVGLHNVSAPTELWAEHAEQLMKIKGISKRILPECNLTLILKGKDDSTIYDENGDEVDKDSDGNFRITRNKIIEFRNKQTSNPKSSPVVVGALSSTLSGNSANGSTSVPSTMSPPTASVSCPTDDRWDLAYFNPTHIPPRTPVSTPAAAASCSDDGDWELASFNPTHIPPRTSAPTPAALASGSSDGGSNHVTTMPPDHKGSDSSGSPRKNRLKVPPPPLELGTFCDHNSRFIKNDNAEQSRKTRDAIFTPDNEQQISNQQDPPVVLAVRALSSAPLQKPGTLPSLSNHGSRSVSSANRSTSITGNMSTPAALVSCSKGGGSNNETTTTSKHKWSDSSGSPRKKPKRPKDPPPPQELTTLPPLFDYTSHYNKENPFEEEEYLFAEITPGEAKYLFAEITPGEEERLGLKEVEPSLIEDEPLPDCGTPRSNPTADLDSKPPKKGWRLWPFGQSSQN